MPKKDAQLATASKVITTDTNGDMVSTIGYGTSGADKLLQLDGSGNLPALNGSALTNLNASNLASGTISDARFPATLPAVSGANLTGVVAASFAGLKTKVKTADETVNNSTTLQNDDTFSFAIGASETWACALFLAVDTSAAADFKYEFTVPASCTGTSYAELANQSGATGLTALTAVGTPVACLIAYSSGQNAVVHITATFVNSTNAGTVQFQWAQNSLVAGNTKVLAGSYMLASKAS